MLIVVSARARIFSRGRYHTSPFGCFLAFVQCPRRGTPLLQRLLPNTARVPRLRTGGRRPPQKMVVGWACFRPTPHRAFVGVACLPLCFGARGPFSPVCLLCPAGVTLMVWWCRPWALPARVSICLLGGFGFSVCCPGAFPERPAAPRDVYFMAAHGR